MITMNTVRRRPGLAFKSGRTQELAAMLRVQDSSAFRISAPLTEGIFGLSRVELALADPRTIVMLASRDIHARCAEVRRIKENVEQIYAEGKEKLSQIII